MQILEYKQPDIPADIYLPEQLGLDSVPLASAEADAAWCDLNPLKKGRLAHFAWKLLRDAHYAQLYADTGSVDSVYEAGFFVDRLSGDQVQLLAADPHDLTTPYVKLRQNMENADGEGAPVVLLTTGGFSPIHYGHISMMETAKHALENQGRRVIGGYVSPSHDHYVYQKLGDQAALSANHRIHIAQLAVDGSDWLMVDPWESQYLPTDVNFTDVIRRLKDYLNHFVSKDEELEVFYVAGADNAGFAKVLQYMDGGVCVSRGPQYNELPEPFTEPAIAQNPNVIFVPSDAAESEFSSSKVRQWKPLLMPKDASIDYFAWRINSMNEDHDVPYPVRHYIVRDDGEWSMQQYYPEGVSETAKAALSSFRAGIASAIKKAFEEIDLPDVRREVDIHFFSLAEQQELVDKLVAARATLNLDACTNAGDKGINFSRLFGIAEGQHRPYDLVARPGFPPLAEQIGQIAAGDYLFLDDDIASGSTLNHLIALLPEEVRITAIKTLFNESRRLHPEANTYEVTDMVDLKDFILGAYVSGLVVSAPDGSLARAPYMLPFVSGYSRAHIPLSSVKSFSEAGWRLNKELFAGLDKVITLGETTPEFQELMHQLGFDNSTPLEQIASYYQGLLERSEQPVTNP